MPRNSSDQSAISPINLRQILDDISKQQNHQLNSIARITMADDTRQQPKEDLSKEALTIDKDYQAFSGDQWKDAKKDFRSAPANMLAGGKQNTAGGNLPEISVSAAFDGGLKLEDITNFPYRPCVRDTLLQGLGSGFALGGGRLILRGEAR